MIKRVHEKERLCKTPLKELCEQALKHYEEISTKAMHWNSLIPKAIKFYQENYKEVLT